MAAQHTVDSLADAVVAYYRAQGFSASKAFKGATKTLVQALAMQPQVVASRDGMEHLVYAFGRVQDSTYKLLKQVIFDLDLRDNAYHVVLAIEKRVSGTDERALREMGVGVLQIRSGGGPVQLVAPQLRSFRGPRTLDRIPARMRPRVREILRRVREEDVCVAVLDLAQLLEQELDRVCAPKRATASSRPPTLGTLIGEARGHGILPRLPEKAAERVNGPRKDRAHPRTNADRRRLVCNAESIVEDCLAVLFAIDGR